MSSWSRSDRQSGWWEKYHPNPAKKNTIRERGRGSIKGGGQPKKGSKKREEEQERERKARACIFN